MLHGLLGGRDCLVMGRYGLAFSVGTVLYFSGWGFEYKVSFYWPWNHGREVSKTNDII